MYYEKLMSILVARFADEDKIITLNRVLDELEESYKYSDDKHLKRQLKRCIRKLNKQIQKTIKNV